MRHAFEVTDFYFFHSPSCRDLNKNSRGRGVGDYYLSLPGGGGIWGILSVILQRNGLEWLPNLGNSLIFSLLVFGLQSKYASSILHVSYTTLYQSVFQIILNSEKLFFSHFENIQCVLTIKDFQLIHVCTANLKKSGACYINHRTHEDPWNLYHGTEMITLYFIMLIYLNISK